MQLMIISFIDYLISWFGSEMSENSEKCRYKFLNFKMMSLHVLFYPVNSPKPKHIQFTVYNTEKLLIFTSEKQNLWYFCFKKLLKY